jgi:hypothetical protein
LKTPAFNISFFEAFESGLDLVAEDRDAYRLDRPASSRSPSTLGASESARDVGRRIQSSAHRRSAGSRRERQAGDFGSARTTPRFRAVP